MSWSNPYGSAAKSAAAEESRRRVLMRKAEDRFISGLKGNYQLSHMSDIQLQLEQRPTVVPPVPRPSKKLPAVVQPPDAPPYRLIHTFTDNIQFFEVTHGGAHIWTSDSDGNIAIRSGLQGTVVHSLIGDGTKVTCLWASPTHMFIGMEDGTVRIYDHTLFIHITEGAFHTAAVKAFCSLQHGRTMSCAADGTLVKWDNDAKGFEALLKVVTGHTDKVNCAVAHGRVIYTGSDDSTVRAVDADTGEAIATLEGHTGPVQCLAVLHSFLFSTDSEKTLRVWNTTTNALVKSIGPMEAQITSLNVDLASMRLWASRDDGVVEVWVAQDDDEVAVERSIATAHQHPLVGVRIMCAVDSVKIWSIGSNGVNKVWYSCVNRLEERLNDNIGALKAVISQDTQELDRWRELIKKLSGLDSRRKTQIANALSTFADDSLRRRAIFAWQMFVHSQHVQRRKIAVSKRLSESEQVRLMRRYYGLLFRFSRSRRMARLKEAFVRVQLKHIDDNAVRVYFAKLQAFVRGMKEAKKRRELALALGNQSNRGLLRAEFRKWLKFATAKKTTRQKMSYMACILRSSDLSLMRVYYVKLRQLTLRVRDRQRKRDVMAMLLTASSRALRRHAYNLWATFVTRQRSRKRKAAIAACLAGNSERALVADIYRRWVALRYQRRREQRATARRAAEEDLNLVREKYGELQKVIEMKKENDQLAQKLSDTRASLEERRGALLRLRAQRDELLVSIEKFDEESARRQLSWREQLANLIARLKAKALNFSSDFTLISQIRERAKQIPVRQIFLEEHQKVKRVVVDLTKQPHLLADQEWPLTFALLGRIPAFQMGTILSSIKTMIVTFDMMDKATRDSMTTDQEIVINAKWLLLMADISLEHRRKVASGGR